MVIDLTPDNFDQIVLNSDLPVLVDFFAAWCGPCKAAAPIVDELADDYTDQLAVGKVDIDQHPELARGHDVTSIPTVILFRDGEEVDRIMGFGGREGYERLVSQVIDKR